MREPKPYETRMADAIAARHVLTAEQRALALAAIVAAPTHAGMDGRGNMLPVDLHAVALAAARGSR